MKSSSALRLRYCFAVLAILIAFLCLVPNSGAQDWGNYCFDNPDDPMCSPGGGLWPCDPGMPLPGCMNQKCVQESLFPWTLAYTYEDEDLSDGQLLAWAITVSLSETNYEDYAYADVTIAMPDGTSSFGYDAGWAGYSDAIAIVPISASTQTGDGLISTNHHTVYTTCGGEYIAALSFPFFFHLDECSCTFKSLAGDMCRLGCACVPGFETEDMVQTTEVLADQCLRHAGATIPPRTCPAHVSATRFSIITEWLIAAFDRVNSCSTSIQ